MELLKLNFNIYKLYKNNKEDEFIVDFDEVYKWIGFTRKGELCIYRTGVIFQYKKIENSYFDIKKYQVHRNGENIIKKVNNK